MLDLNKELKKYIENVIEATKIIMASYEEQKSMFSENFPIADEIALNFSDEVVYQVEYFKKNNLITDIQYQKIKALDEKLNFMSSDKSKDYWSIEALKTFNEWAECRELAKKILKEFIK
ncbi:MAG: hypothetical protein ABF289_08785 [Clostridiales bacterium]